jgi:hypothetical protein
MKIMEIVYRALMDIFFKDQHVLFHQLLQAKQQVTVEILQMEFVISVLKDFI